MEPEEARLSLLAIPYDAAAGRSLAQFLVDELVSQRWLRFSAAVAYARASANWPKFVEALEAFAKAGNSVELTFGANGARDEPGTDLGVIRELLNRLAYSGSQVHLYYEIGRLFHPKLYLFDNERQGKALLITGSSNWTSNGLTNNVEANLIARLDLGVESERALFDSIRGLFTKYWQECPPGTDVAGTGRARRLTKDNLPSFAALLRNPRDNGDAPDTGDDPGRNAPPLDPAVVAAEGLFAGNPITRVQPFPRTADELVFLQEVPKGGSRWQQGNVPIQIWKEFFGADEPQDFVLIAVDEDGKLREPEVRRGGAREVSSNYGVEIGIAGSGPYPAQRPIRVVLSLGNRRFTYMLLMPEDTSYQRAAEILRQFSPRTAADKPRRALVKRSEIQEAWPELPLWAASSKV